MKTIIITIILFIFIRVGFSQTIEVRNLDSLCDHLTQYDDTGGLLGWYKPDIPGASYDHVIKLASEFMLNVPNEKNTNVKLYFVSCGFNGPHMHNQPVKKAPGGLVASSWMHNPACVFSRSEHSFASKYYQYTGDERYIKMTCEMLDFQLEHGTTPKGWIWEKVPYASSNPFEIEYKGATKWESEGMRGDGLYGIEPDKVGEMAYAYLKFYEISGDTKYLNASINCADALANHVRITNFEKTRSTESNTIESPWPFRVNAQTGVIISQYCSNVVGPIKLFDELIRVKSIINIENEKIELYQKARQIAWDWLYSNNGPI